MQVELPKAHAPGLDPLAVMHRGNYEAADDEKRVDAYESARRRRPRAKGHEHQDRNGSQTLDLRAAIR
jgi:hypothetical protein